MKTIFLIKIVLLSVLTMACNSLLAQPVYQWATAGSDGYSYKYVSNDPSNSRFYTLKNGLTVILSPNTKQPRIQTYIAVKAGSKTDPKEHTGLAHYLEHMLFKGTDKYGSLDWPKEKVFLDKIDELYEQFNRCTDQIERKKIYKVIDQLSGQAAKYAILNEYDKLMSNMGAKGSNAFTSYEQTVYVEDIPNNVIDKYLSVQAERFRNPILRLFHTELEAVYEEKNINLDNDNRKTMDAMFGAMFPNNNYGRQTILGSVEHLKNPSLNAIRTYYKTYYVPNNMAIIMCGDFDPTVMIKRIDENFGYMVAKPIPEYTFEKEKVIESPISKNVSGSSSDYLLMGFRFPGAANPDVMMLNLIAKILNNGTAGLFDINLLKGQKLLGAEAYPYILKDYSMLILRGDPAQEQNLEDVKKLILNELQRLRRGEFSDDLITSIVNNEKKSQINKFDLYKSNAYQLLTCFTSELDWSKELNYIDRLSTITKEDIMQFANQYLSDSNYVVVFKNQGIDRNVLKIEKPEITPVNCDRHAESSFLKRINAMPENTIQPRWINFNQDISRSKLKDLPVLSVQNNDNEIFNLTYQFDIGQWDNRMLNIALGYLEFLGTKDKNSDEFSGEFYKLASYFGSNIEEEESQIFLNGLNSNFKASVELLHDLLRHCTVNETAFHSYIDRLKKMRSNAKENKEMIMEGLKAYALYGAQNPFNYTYTDRELDNLKAIDLVKMLHNLADAKYHILYYGPLGVTDLVNNLEPLKNKDSTYFKIEKGRKFVEKPTVENRVLFVQYSMKQAEVLWIRNSGLFDKKKMPLVTFFNGYFGSGIGSIIFQTLRESKALAYTTYAFYGHPQKKENHDIFSAYIGTQSDKFNDAVVGMNELLSQLPESKVGLESVRSNLLKSLASERIMGADILSSYLTAQRRGLHEDFRKVIFEKLPQLNFSDLKAFHTENVSHQPYIYCIVGNERDLNMSSISKMGGVQKLSLEEVFGY